MKSNTALFPSLSLLLALTGCASSVSTRIDPVLMEPPRPTPIIDEIVTSIENSSPHGKTGDNSPDSKKPSAPPAAGSNP